MGFRDDVIDKADTDISTAVKSAKVFVTVIVLVLLAYVWQLVEHEKPDTETVASMEHCQATS